MINISQNNLLTLLFLTTFLFCIVDDSIGQKKKSFYLIDNFDSTQVSKVDLDLLHTMLPSFHAEKDPLMQLEILAELLSQYWDEMHWHDYNLFYLEQAKMAASSPIENIKEGAIEYLADAYNNEGYALNALGYPDSAMSYYKQAAKLNRTLEDLNSLATNYNNIGTILDDTEENDSAVIYYNKAIEFYKKANDKGGYAVALNNLAGIYYDKGDLLRALKDYHTARAIQERIEDFESLSNTFIKLAFLYANVNDSLNEIEYLLKSKAIRDSLNDDIGLIKTHLFIGQHFDSHQNYSSALRHFQIADKLIHRIGVMDYAPDLYNAKSALFLNIEEMDSCLAYGLKALGLGKKLNYIGEVATAYQHLASAYLAKNENSIAKIYADSCLHLSEELNNQSLQYNCLKLLSSIHHALSNPQLAYAYLKKANEIDEEDRILATQKALLTNGFQRQLAAQITSDSLKQRITQQEAEKEIMAKDLALKSSRYQNFLLFGGIACAAFIIFLLYRQNQNKKRDNQIIKEQKEEVSKQRDIAQENLIIAKKARQQVEIRNEEILDSIKYAKRLQEAVLPPQKLVKEWLTNSFILYKPKDIVSGDFYWMETANYTHKGKTYSMVFFAAADCTGHGVPGAMVSVVCAGALNRAVNEFELHDVGNILNKVSELVVDAFKRSEGEVKDGMDIALCGLDISRKVLHYTGANNPLWIISENETLTTECTYRTFTSEDNKKHYLHEVKALRKPVGLSDSKEEFKTNEIQLSAGDAVYVFSDGYVDQFGGPNGKKFKSFNLKMLLLNNCSVSMAEQKSLLNETFEKWKGDIEQLDDVCVLGVRINGKERANYTNREIEVAEYLAQGLPSKLIASEMNISTHTVDTYRRRLLAKSNCFNTTELINYCKSKEII